MSKQVKIMGIVNITDDSFYSASRAYTIPKLKELLARHIEEGVDIIDFGACSTRPGSVSIPVEEEWGRLRPAIQLFKQLYPTVPFSVDTFRAPIVQRCYEDFGPFMVNDISSGEDDSRMLPLVGRIGLSYIAMHKRGTPLDMQEHCQYDDLVEDILQYFRDFDKRAQECGVEKWILDPGFGFSKTMEQNYLLLEHLDRFQELKHEIMVGISRKSFIYRKLGVSPSEALPETTRLHIIAIKKGADILRVHDVAAAKKILNL